MGSYSVHEPRHLPGSSRTATALGAARARRVPHSSEDGVALTQPLTRPRERPSSPEPLRDSVSQLMPKEERQQARGRPLHAESTPGREEAAAHPLLPGKPPGDTPASAAHLPVALGSRLSEPQLPGYLSLGPAGQPWGRPGPG